jgi:hypothetical protein
MRDGRRRMTSGRDRRRSLYPDRRPGRPRHLCLLDQQSGVVVGASDIPGASSGFLLRDGVLTSFRVPDAHFTQAQGINDAGTIVGLYNDGNHTSGFVLDGGVFTTIQVPGALDTVIYGINDAGTLVGIYNGADGITHAFVANVVPEPSSALLAAVAFPLIVAWAPRRRAGQDA